MPELPEVETVRRGLAEQVLAARIVAVDVYGERTLRRHPEGPADFAARLIGRQFVAAKRRGKYLWLPLDDGQAMLAHLGMSGQFRIAEPGEDDQRNLRARLTLQSATGSGTRELRFIDQRTFGGLALADDGDPVPPALGHVAPDPMEAAFDDAEFTAKLRRRRTGIKRALLDQTLISGIGNIYADEALWLAKLHYARPTELLRPGDVERVLVAVRDVLAAAIRAGGTSFDALYVAVNGESGWFERSLEVYGQAGEPCSRCGAIIRREAFTNRSSFRCPRCQPVPRAPRW